MRKSLLVTGQALLFLIFFWPVPGNTQLLNWLTSFVPAWSTGNTSGSANNLAGTGIDCSTTISLSGGSFTNALGGSGAQTPTVSGATFTVPGSGSRMQITPNFAGNSNYCDIVFTFSGFVTNVSFRIVDIDKSSSNSTTYFDRVTVTGSNGVTTFNATLSKYDAVTDPDFLVISGNTAQVSSTNGEGGNTASDGSDQRGTVDVSFGSLGLTSVTIHYDNAPGTNSNPAAQAIGIGSLSFTPSSTLPATLYSFAGSRAGDDVVLKWTTLQEINTASFELERRAGNNAWQQVAAIAAQGNSGQEKNYVYVDVNPEKTVLLYRLRLNDLDGQFKYSPVVRISNSDSKASLLVFPNPFASQVTVSLHSPGDQSVIARILDISGKMIRSSAQPLVRGNNSFTINGLERLKQGVYLLEILDTEKRSVGNYRLIKH